MTEYYCSFYYKLCTRHNMIDRRSYFKLQWNYYAFDTSIEDHYHIGIIRVLSMRIHFIIITFYGR